MNFPADLKYTKDHEWVRFEGDAVVVGITDFAQGELGDIVFVEVETIGQELNANAVFGTIEAVKTVADLFLPISGTILEKNPALEGEPELVNNDPYGAGWIVRMRPAEGADHGELMDAAAYQEMVNA